MRFENQVKIRDWLMSNSQRVRDEGLSMASSADAATRELGFVVTESNISSKAPLCGLLPWPRKKTSVRALRRREPSEDERWHWSDKASASGRKGIVSNTDVQLILYYAITRLLRAWELPEEELELLIPPMIPGLRNPEPPIHG